MTVSTSIDLNGGVLVAHDGSTHAQAALRMAARLAEALRLDLTVVRVWNLGTAPRPESSAVGYMPPIEDFEAATAAALERDVEPVRAATDGITIRTAVAQGSAARVLLDASKNADLMVVGSRGLGGFAGLVLGSVSEQVVRHAACPVLVDRERSGHDSTGDDRDQLEQALASELKLD